MEDCMIWLSVAEEVLVYGNGVLMKTAGGS